MVAWVLGNWWWWGCLLIGLVGVGVVLVGWCRLVTSKSRLVRGVSLEGWYLLVVVSKV